jgi:hypothetical protein
MRNAICLFVTVMFTVVGIASFVGAEEVAEEIILFRSQHDEAVPDPSVEWCKMKAVESGLLPEAVAQALPPEAIATLGASLWSLRTRASNGTVNNEMVRQIGVADACGYIIEGLGEGAKAPFYMEGNAGGLDMAAAGECSLVTNNIPVDGIILTGCALKVDPDPEQGLLGGLAASNSVFNPFGVVGFNTGSFWTIHVYWE